MRGNSLLFRIEAYLGLNCCLLNAMIYLHFTDGLTAFVRIKNVIENNCHFGSVV